MMRSVPVGAPQPWPPPSFSTFCSPGTCSISCPQWYCGSHFLPPPPPFLLDPSNSDDDDDSSHISPLMAALISVLAAAFLVLFYYTVLSRFFRQRTRRRRTNQILNSVEDEESEIRIDPMVAHDPGRPGLDDSFIRQITVFKYRKNDGLIDGSDCAVCLSEFKEEENLRLMPNCEHAFHIPCIDTWLKSHSSCPLCRATMNPAPTRTNDPNSGISVAALQVQRRNDVVLVVREVEERAGEVIVCHDGEESPEKIDRR